MQNNPVGWFEIYVQDLARAKKFYEAVLNTQLESIATPVSGVELLAFPMEHGAMGCAGALVKMDGFPVGSGGTLVYFRSEDCATELGRVAAAGGKVQREKTAIGPWGFIAIGVDTEGNMFGLHSAK